MQAQEFVLIDWSGTFDAVARLGTDCDSEIDCLRQF